MSISNDIQNRLAKQWAMMVDIINNLELNERLAYCSVKDFPQFDGNKALERILFNNASISIMELCKFFEADGNYSFKKIVNMISNSGKYKKKEGIIDLKLRYQRLEKIFELIGSRISEISI
jgi:aminopeptidase-like protein